MARVCLIPLALIHPIKFRQLTTKAALPVPHQAPGAVLHLQREDARPHQAPLCALQQPAHSQGRGPLHTFNICNQWVELASQLRDHTPAPRHPDTLHRRQLRVRPSCPLQQPRQRLSECSAMGQEATAAHPQPNTLWGCGCAQTQATTQATQTATPHLPQPQQESFPPRQ